MADRYQDRPFSADGFGRGGDQQQRAEADPLAELARLIGQNDASAASGRGVPPLPPRAAPPNQYQPLAEEDKPAAGPPPWMRRANPQEIPRESQRETQRDFPGSPAEPPDYPSSTHPLQPRFAAQPPSLEPNFHHEEPGFAATEDEPDPARYDEALFGQVDSGAQDDFQHPPAFSDDPYGYQDDGYEDENEEPEPKRRGGLLKVVAVLALAVVGTGAAFAYRTYVGSSRSGEPPIIKADNTPTKVMPAQPDGAKVPDRLAMGDGTEKLVPREEAPVDVNSRSIGGGPRVVFPQLNQNGNPPTPSSVSPNGMPQVAAPGVAAPGNGALANNEPRRIRTLSVRGDQPDGAAAPAPAPPATKPAAGAKTAARTAPSPANANASANAPVTLSPQSAQDSVPAPADQRARVAATTPAPTAPAASAASTGAIGGYLVQISSQRSEADAQASFKALQGKFPAVLGSQTPVIKRAELGDKGVYYRAMVGPFGTSDEAAQFCNSLRGAGGQCFVPKN
jgi:hypothetical protein